MNCPVLTCHPCTQWFVKGRGAHAVCIPQSQIIFYATWYYEHSAPSSMSEARSCWAVVLFIWTLDAQVHALVLLNPARCILLDVPIATVPPLPFWIATFFLLAPTANPLSRKNYLNYCLLLTQERWIYSLPVESWLVLVQMLAKTETCLSYSLPCQQGMCWCMPLKTQDKSSVNRSAAAIVISIHLSITTQPKWLGILIGRDMSLE